MQIGTFGGLQSGAAFERIVDKIHNGVRVVADDGEVFAEVEVLNGAVDDKGLCHQARQGE